MSALLMDLRVAVRSFLRTPALVVVAVLSLGLGIGALSTVYLWTDRFIHRPLPLVPDADRLTFIRTAGPGGVDDGVSYLTARDWGERNRAFDGLSVMTLQAVGVRELAGEGAERAWTGMVGGNYFDVLGTRALYGRTFQPDEEGRAAPVAVLGYEYWTRRFRADQSVIGRPIIVNGQQFEVVGVMPPTFGGGYVGLNLDLYALITTFPTTVGEDRLKVRRWYFLDVVGRLKPGVSIADASADMKRVGRELDAIYPDALNTASVKPLDGQGAPSIMKPVFAALMVVTGLVLLIACANVANLLLARATGRQKEIGVRLALGASRLRLVRQLLTESALLAAAGGVLGLWLAYLGRTGLAGLMPPVPYPIAMAYEMNTRVVLFGFVTAVITVALFGLWPALQASRPDLVSVLKDVPTVRRARSAGRWALVAGQMALAVVSLACAGLFLRAIDRSRTIDPGFRDSGSLLLVDTDLTIAGLNDSTGSETIGRLLDRVRSIPGVVNAAAATFVPLGWACCSSQDFEVEGYQPAPKEDMSLVYSRVTDGYFETMGIRPLAGRSLNRQDDRKAANSVVVNEAFVRRFWRGQSPIGRRLRRGPVEYTVVGLVPDGKYRGLTAEPFPLVYLAFAQSYDANPTLHVRATGDPTALMAGLRAQFKTVNLNLPMLDPRTMRQQMQQSTIGQEIGSKTLTVFGLVALLLAAVGIYGVMSYLVNQRRREIGIRVALGAATGRVAALVVRDGLKVTLAGAVIGVVVAIGAGRLLSGMLLGVSPADPVTFAVIGVLLVTVAVAACVVPAWRAARIDPIDALKGE